MPNNKIISDLIKKLDSVNSQLTDHLIEGGSVKNDIRWLKWFVMGMAAGIGALALAALTYVIKGH